VASLHGRTTGSFIREFIVDPANADLATLDLKEITERLRRFYFDYYRSFAEKVHGKPFDEIPTNVKGLLGLVVGGFSPGSFLSEIWNIEIPTHCAPYSAVQKNAPGNFGFSWYASSAPITRYLKGIDQELGAKVRSQFEVIVGRPLNEEELGKFQEILNGHEYRIKVEGMPIQSGAACARFLVDFVIGHYVFAETHPIVGGKPKIGIVTYSHDAFTISD